MALKGSGCRKLPPKHKATGFVPLACAACLRLVPAPRALLTGRAFASLLSARTHCDGTIYAAAMLKKVGPRSWQHGAAGK